MANIPINLSEMELLRVEHVTKRYAAHTALDDVSLSIPQGAVYGLLGPNGAGKTTLIRIINRITAPDQGRVWFGDRELAPEDVNRIGYLPEERGLYKKMRVGEQALFFARLKGMSRSEAIRRLKMWFEKFGIGDWWNKKVEELSKGMAQKVQFIITVLHEPELLIFDEPFSGFDPINANLLKEEILELKRRGATIIFSTHNMSSVEEICDHITLINRSHNVLSGPVDEIRRSYGKRLYRIDFLGSDQQAEELERMLARYGTTSRPSKEESGYRSLRVQLSEQTRLRELLSQVNERVDVRNFVEQIPSMNDIFIRVVGETTPADRSDSSVGGSVNAIR